MKKLLLLPFVLCVLLYLGCKNEQTGKNDNKYSGEEFKDHVRSTPARTPEEERLGFKLPQGFEITLYASEPDIGKPINIAFDAKGRVWVTQSFEYPFAATPGKGRDKVSILEDTDNDGKADKFVHFNDTLNIPIGVMPVNDGAVVYSIPNVYRFTDANGDGKPDKQNKLLGPFEYRDTHGMVNNFIIGYDGWIHACHGFTNRSSIAAADGDSIHMRSGNTFRFRRDGSRVEHTTDGRINPFGLAYDELGYLYSTDCHTSPLYQLIRGGDYTQWGKDDLMGFAPDMKHLEDEATALAGIAYYADTRFPKEYRNNFYIGDAVSCRVYRNSSTWKGSSPVGKKEDDFVLSEDPSFRPVDVKLGPDGALYIADFYNSIIGHYEVPLDHPKRDKTRGRIWRITYKGEANKKQDFTAANTQALLESLRSDNLSVRLTAADQLVERIGRPAINPVVSLINENDVSVPEYVHSLWILQRLNALTPDIISKSSKHPETAIRLHTMRVLIEQQDSSAGTYQIAKQGLLDKDAHVQRAAVELVGNFPTLESVSQVIAHRKKTLEDDSHLIYTDRLVLRNLLRNENLMGQVVSRKWSPDEGAVLASVLPGVQTTASGQLLFNYLRTDTLRRDELERAFKHVAQFVPDAHLNELVNVAKSYGNGDPNLEFIIFRQVQDGIARRGAKENHQLQQWGKNLAMQLLPTGTTGRVNKENENEKQQAVDRLTFAMNLAGKYQLSTLQPQLLTAFKDSAVEPDIRISALRALLRINHESNLPSAKSVYESGTSTDNFRKRILGLLGEFPGQVVNNFLATIGTVPPDLQPVMATSLAASPQGIDILFAKVKKGDLFARMLLQPKVEERILLNMNARQRKEFETLTANLEDINQQKQSLISGRITDFAQAKPAPSADVGRTVFVRNCATCHSIGGEGGSIGPQLDGVGNWGPSALIEKVLDPNRNVSESFRNYTLKLKDNKVLSGLYRREEGAVLVFADVSGKEFTIPKSDIVERTPSKYSLMPDQFATSISQQDFNALISYLLTVKN